MAKRLSLSDKAYSIIKENIVNLTFPPGMILTEVKLAEELNMSRNPIRSAIKHLQAEGLIVTDFHKAMMVREITEDDIREIYELREIIETKAFKTIFETNQHEAYSYKLEEAVIKMCAAAEDVYQWEVADTKIHMIIVSVLENERINKIYEQNLAESIRMGLYTVKNGIVMQQTNDNLRKMIKYMRDGDYENSFKILMEDHFTLALDRLLN